MDPDSCVSGGEGAIWKADSCPISGGTGLKGTLRGCNRRGRGGGCSLGWGDGGSGGRNGCDGDGWRGDGPGSRKHDLCPGGSWWSDGQEAVYIQRNTASRADQEQSDQDPEFGSIMDEKTIIFLILTCLLLPIIHPISEVFNVTQHRNMIKFYHEALIILEKRF